jgi:serine protease Do
MKQIWSKGWPVALFLCVAFATPGANERSDKGPWLGVRLGGPAASEEGVQLSRIFVDSPADRAGLRAHDVILTFGGEPVSGLRDLIGRIRLHDTGAWVPMTVLRQGEKLELDVRLGDRPESVDVGAARRGWIGVAAIELPESLREHFGAPADAGVMLSEVTVGSPAEAAGFRLGDIVYEVGGEAVRSPRLLRELVEGGGVGNEYEFLVARDGALLELESRIEKRPAE